MPWSEILTSSIVATVVSGIISWLGKRYLDKKLEIERANHIKELEDLKAENQKFLENYRARLKNSEIYFNRQLDACDEIHALCQSMLPKNKFPNMDWDDALEYMALDIERIESEAQGLYTKFYSVLPDSILTKLNASVGYAGDAKFETGGGEVSKRGLELVKSTFNELHEAAVNSKELLDGQRHRIISPPSKK